MTHVKKSLELYHAAESICSERVRMTLYEKHIIDWVDRPMLLFEDEQFARKYLKLNPKAQVPTLVHDGHVVRESSIICNYLDDIFPQNSLKPVSPHSRANMQEWIKGSDEELYQAVSSLSFSMVFRDRLNGMSREAREGHFMKQTEIDRTHRQRSCVADGMSSPYVLRAVAAWETLLQKLEAVLEKDGPWILGDQYSLVEIALGPFFMRVQDLQILPIWMQERPLTVQWWNEVQRRSNFIMAQVGVGSDKLAEYELAADKYGSKIKTLRDWYLEDPIDCGRAFKIDKGVL